MSYNKFQNYQVVYIKTHSPDMIETAIIAYTAVGVFGINLQYLLLVFNYKLVEQLMLKLERYVNMSK